MSKTIISPNPLTADAIERAAHADRDAQPLTEADLKRMKRTRQAKIIRRALELTQEEFAARYHIPLGTLRDWEQGRAEPDQPTLAYLTLIARDPEHVNRTLNMREIFVVRHDDGWAVKRPDAERSSAVTATQAEAIELARKSQAPQFACRTGTASSGVWILGQPDAGAPEASCSAKRAGLKPRAG